MLPWNSLAGMIAFLTVFILTCGTGFVLFIKTQADRRRARARLRDLGGADARTPEKPGAGDLNLFGLAKPGPALTPLEENRRVLLKTRLIQAGYYRSNTARLFALVRLILMLALPPLAGLPLFLLGVLSWSGALTAGALAFGVAWLGPGLWLEYRVKCRQGRIRHGLPDALDVLVMCLEGGLSLMAAAQRLVGELQAVHPVLGSELSVFQREMQLGLSPGDALKKLGERTGLDEVRDLASVLLQSERFGASVVKALRGYADSWRVERQQRAEELAQKAAVKILFPTLLFIFPAIFIVLLGPAAFQVAGLFSK